MSAFHVIYGLQLAANMALPGLLVRRYSETPDLEVHLKKGWPLSITFAGSDENQYSVSGLHSNLWAGRSQSGEHFGLFYADGARFAVERRGREVWGDWPENYTLEDACTYLVGPVMGFVLRLRGTVCLHASAAAVDGRAVALVGLPGAGKSTTAAAFACAGFAVLSDDVVALADNRKQFLVQPGYPRVNLWPDSVCRLFGSENALPRIAPTWEKRYLPLDENGHHFASSPLPLGAIYILEGRGSAHAAPIIEEISGKEAFMTLVANTYVNYLLDQDMRRTEFDVVSRIVSEIPVRRVRPPNQPAAIPGLCEVIAADASQVMASASARDSAVLR